MEKNNKSKQLKPKKLARKSLEMCKNRKWGIQVKKQYFTCLILVHLIYDVYSEP